MFHKFPQNFGKKITNKFKIPCNHIIIEKTITVQHLVSRMGNKCAFLYKKLVFYSFYESIYN